MSVCLPSTSVLPETLSADSKLLNNFSEIKRLVNLRTIVIASKIKS